jgi:hypothetical protein
VPLERLKLGEEGVIYETKDGEQRQYEALEFLALLSSHNLSAVGLPKEDPKKI